jgi:acyl-coenzyme A thioesterase PaaI-like protein
MTEQQQPWAAEAGAEAGGGRASFGCEPDPEHPGWLRWKLNDPTRYNEAVLGRFLVRREDVHTARCRIFPARHLTNLSNQIHGAAILGLIDICFFAGMQVLSGNDVARGMTVEVNTQFMAPGDPAKPLDAVVELLSETGRFCFMRGLIVQDEVRLAAFSGMLRKAAAVS